MAWILKPAAAATPLPGVVAFHCHGGFKFYGKEKIADSTGETPQMLDALRTSIYGGRAFANELARAGFVVLAHDVFGWGSRRFPFDEMPELLRQMATATVEVTPLDKAACVPSDVALYNAAASHHEQVVEKYCALLDRHVLGHTWMCFPPAWARRGDWPDLAAARAPSPLLVQYDRDDHLFTLEGMEAAHARIAEHYRRAGPMPTPGSSTTDHTSSTLRCRMRPSPGFAGDLAPRDGAVR